MLPLQSKLAIVTGASRGLGREIARHLGAAGADLFLVARNAERLHGVAADIRAKTGATVKTLAIDLTTEDASPKIISTCERPDILINNAAVQGPIGPLERVPFAQWQAVFATNLFAPARLCQLAGPMMRQRGGGKIVNISGGGATSPRRDFSAYAASKCALVRLTETLAEEWADARIDVNAVAPGAMNTGMTAEVIAAGAAASAEFAKTVNRQQADTAAVMSKAAELVTFLASPACDGISGRLISAVWDDWRALAGSREQLRGTDRFTLRRIA